MKKKKVWPIVKWGCVVVLALGISADWMIRTVTSRAWFREYVVEQTQHALGREMRAGKIVASLFGVRLLGVAVAEEGGFEKGEFLTVERAQMHFSLLHLLHVHIKISHLILQGVDLKIIRLKDGKFNFESIGEPTEKKEEQHKDKDDSFPRITIENVSFDNLSFVYQNELDGQTFSAREISLGVKEFAFDKEFPLAFNTILRYQDNTQDVLFPVGLTANVQLANLDFSKAYADKVDFSLKYKKNLLRLKGRVKNWKDPVITATLTSKNLSSDVAAPWAQLPDFELKEIEVYADGQVKTSQNEVVLSSGTIHVPGGDLFIAGKYNYGKNTYDTKGDCAIDWTEMGRWLPKEYNTMNLKGWMDGTFAASTQQAKADVSLKEGALFYPSTGNFTQLVAKISAQESMDFKTGQVTGEVNGNLNQNPFHLDLSIDQTPKNILAQLNASAKRVALPPAPAPKEEEPEFVEEAQLDPLTTSKWTLPPIHLKANVEVDSLDAPYLYATNLQFSSDLEGVTPQLNQTQGKIGLKMGEGKILDLYKLTNANALTKVLFLSLNITGKVFNSLNVFSVLNGLKKGVVSAVTGKDKTESQERMLVQTMLDEEGNPIEVMVPYSETKTKGQMAYDKLDTDLYFDRGVASIKRGTFVSDMMSFRLDGTTDFNSGDIKMKVHAAPGKHEVDGMLPLTVNITGTVSEPKGSMSMVGSVASLVKQSVANNVVSRQVTKGVKGVLGIFKKKDDGNEDTETTEEVPTQEETEENTQEETQSEEEPAILNAETEEL